MLIFGVYFYHALPIFQFMDELLSWSLLMIAIFISIAKKDFKRFNKLWLVLAIFIFYLLYSIFISKVNTPQASLSDFLVQLKPYITFFVVYAIAPKFTPKQKTWLRYICVTLALLMLIIYLLPGDVWEIVFFHPAVLGISAVVLSMIYLTCSYGTKKDKIITTLILMLGLLGGRSKFYGFFIVALFMLFFFKREMLSHIKIKYIIVALLILAVILVVSWKKVSFYFINGEDFSSQEMTETIARAAFYAFSFPVMIDYFPFGPGFATYATYFSAHPYSPLYAEYGMDKIWGLSEEFSDFVADTFYPVLAQFGFVGLFLFIIFIRFMFLQIKRGANTLTEKGVIVAFLMLTFILIESVASSAFISGGGIIAMILMGISLTDYERERGVIYGNK